MAHHASQRSALGWLFVAAQIVLVAALLAELRRVWHASPLRRSAGGLLASLGVVLMAAAGVQLGRSLHPHPAPAAATKLRADGLYRHVRHPIYAGLLLWAVGTALTAGTARAATAFAALLALLALKAPYEERQLASRFPEYAAYARRTPRWFPRLRPRREDDPVEPG
ncbi:MAG: isoprenylcysteine carboxylmethyltransferase family protein [Dehalococcoidia bacterium]